MAAPVNAAKPLDQISGSATVTGSSSPFPFPSLVSQSTSLKHKKISVERAFHAVVAYPDIVVPQESENLEISTLYFYDRYSGNLKHSVVVDDAIPQSSTAHHLTLFSMPKNCHYSLPLHTPNATPVAMNRSWDFPAGEKLLRTYISEATIITVSDKGTVNHYDPVTLQLKRTSSLFSTPLSATESFKLSSNAKNNENNPSLGALVHDSNTNLDCLHYQHLISTKMYQFPIAQRDVVDFKFNSKHLFLFQPQGIIGYPIQTDGTIGIKPSIDWEFSTLNAQLHTTIFEKAWINENYLVVSASVSGQKGCAIIFDLNNPQKQPLIYPNFTFYSGSLRLSDDFLFAALPAPSNTLNTLILHLPSMSEYSLGSEDSLDVRLDPQDPKLVSVVSRSDILQNTVYITPIPLSQFTPIQPKSFSNVQTAAQGVLQQPVAPSQVLQPHRFKCLSACLKLFRDMMNRIGALLRRLCKCC